jgi:hypothetical protein
VHRHVLSPATCAGAAASAVVMVAIGLGAPASAAPAHPASTARRAVSTSAPAPGRAARQLLLVNGDRVLAGPAAPDTGPGMILPAGRGGPAGLVIALSLGGASYDVPAAALPYLGHGLDPACSR